MDIDCILLGNMMNIGENHDERNGDIISSDRWIYIYALKF